MKHLMLMTLLLATSITYAQAPANSEPLPTSVASEEADVTASEGDVTISEGKNETVYEYRRNGKLVMVRVQPDQGPPYYFFDADGDGVLEHHEDDPRNSTTAQWMLLRW